MFKVIYGLLRYNSNYYQCQYNCLLDNSHPILFFIVVSKSHPQSASTPPKIDLALNLIRQYENVLTDRQRGVSFCPADLLHSHKVGDICLSLWFIRVSFYLYFPQQLISLLTLPDSEKSPQQKATTMLFHEPSCSHENRVGELCWVS